MKLPLSQFFLLVDMSADKKRRFSALSLMGAALSGKTPAAGRSAAETKLLLTQMGIGRRARS